MTHNYVSKDFISEFLSVLFMLNSRDICVYVQFYNKFNYVM